MLIRHELLAFLGLQDGNGIQMAPDYRLSLLNTIITTPWAIINHAQSLAVFEALYQHKSSDPSAVTYPSWAPNFFHVTSLRSFIGFKASNSTRHVIEDQSTDITDNILHTQGKVVDHLQVLAQPFPFDVKDRAEFRALFDTMLEELALDAPSDVAQWRLFQAAFAEEATYSPIFMRFDHEAAAEKGKREMKTMWERSNCQEEEKGTKWERKSFEHTPLSSLDHNYQ